MNIEALTNDNLEFAIFCIENVAIRLGVGAEKVFVALTEKAIFLTAIFSRATMFCTPKARIILSMTFLM